jgi:hypothetical protein
MTQGEAKVTGAGQAAPDLAPDLAARAGIFSKDRRMCERQERIAD